MTSVAAERRVATTPRRFGLTWQLVVWFVTWLLLWFLLNGKFPLETGTPSFVQDALQNFADNLGFVSWTQPIINVLNGMYDAGIWITKQLGWTGMIGLGTALALVFAGWRMAVLTALGMLSFGVLGLWNESMQTLVLIVISVLLSVLIGIPLGVAAGLSDRFNRILSPILDTLQIMPSIAYLGFIVLFFLIGPPSGIVATLIYAVPPVIRLTNVGIREVPAASVEAARSLGATSWQVLRDVQLPMSRRTRIVGVNQTVMAALSMITIAALVAAPGLGQSVLGALEILNIGQAFNSGLALVIMAIVLDRVISAASERSGQIADDRRTTLTRWGSAAALIAVGALLPAILPKTATWNSAWSHPITDPINSMTDWLNNVLYPITTAFTEWITVWLINPLESLFTGTPWFILIGIFAALALIVGRLQTALTAVVCLAGCVIVALWPDTMVTITQVAIAVALTLLLGLLIGVWIGRSPRADRIWRPILDAGQVLPPFVYLVPCLTLFGSTRLTAIIAAVIYAAPAAIKIVGEGIATVPSDTIEASRSVGSTSWQEILKVQVPMARPIILVALNQGIIYVMAMVVIGGLVGGGGLGYEVVKGFSQERDVGVGLAAGIAIVLLGVMLDRISQSAGRVRRTSSDVRQVSGQAG
jgi:glycine betaine/proline transport system permease protein